MNPTILNPDNPPFSPTLSSLIEQGYRESWSRYQQSIPPRRAAFPLWDWIVLTAADERQAGAFEAQLEWRRKAGLLPQATRFLVVPDPQGRRIGSGGATLHALAEVGRRMASSARARRSAGLAALFARRRILILHSGGQSRRLPHCSAFGKLFARVPRELPDGRASTLFDEFLIALSGLPFRMYEGVFVASGDVLLLFDHRQLNLSRQGVVGVAARAPAALGTRHGVYLTEPGATRVQKFLHKMDLDALRACGAIDAAGRVALDSGMVWFDPSAIVRLLGLFGFDHRLEFAPAGPFGEIAAAGARLNLYSDLLMPLADETDRARYLLDASDGEPGPVVRGLRPAIWDNLRTIPFHVESLSPVEFIPFGTTAEYLATMTEELPARAALGWKSPVASFLAREGATRGVVLVGSSVASLSASGTPPAVVEDSQLGGDLRVGGRCLLSHVQTGRPLALEPGLVLHQLPVIAPDAPPARGFITQLFGVQDNPKLPFDDPAATFLNRPWADWLAEAALTPDDLWGDPAPPERSLWTARLFPFSATRDDTLALTLWMQQPARAGDEQRRRWRAARRFSLAEAARCADVLLMLDGLQQLADLIPVQQYCAAIEHERPSAEAMHLLGFTPADIRRRAAAAAQRFARHENPFLPLRGFKALADALLEQRSNWTLIEEGQRYEDRAFDLLARSIRDATPWPPKIKRARHSRRLSPLRRAVVEAPARLDFAGGWSDTPPFSLEYGGKVLNAAIRLRGALPIRVECERLDRPVLVLESRDLDVSREFDQASAILDYADPSDPLALHKAAVVLAGVVPQRGRGHGGALAPLLERALGAGLRVSTAVNIPHGSGLGTSSILAGALLGGLRVILGRPLEHQAIFDEVLCLEQMLTTGGGWQDQVGGMVGGIKLSATLPGLPQRPVVSPVPVSPEVAGLLRRRLLLVATGQRRLAKGILRAIMGRFMSREPEIVRILCGIRDLAEQLRAAIERGDLEAMGRLMHDHWELNKRLDPGTTNPFLDQLFELCAPDSFGGKLAGAGGGGFMMMIARDDEAPARLAARLEAAYHSPDIAVWPAEISADGLTVIEPA